MHHGILFLLKISALNTVMCCFIISYKAFLITNKMKIQILKAKKKKSPFTIKGTYGIKLRAEIEIKC